MTDSRAAAQQKVQELIDQALTPVRAKTAELAEQIEQTRQRMESDAVARWEEECTALTTQRGAARIKAYALEHKISEAAARAALTPEIPEPIRLLSSSPHEGVTMSAAEETEEQGFSDKDVRKFSLERGLSYEEAFDAFTRGVENKDLERRAAEERRQQEAIEREIEEIDRLEEERLREQHH